MVSDSSVSGGIRKEASTSTSASASTSKEVRRAAGGKLLMGNSYLRLVRASNRSLTGHKVWHDEANSQLMVLSPHGTYSSVHLSSPYDGPGASALMPSFALNAARLSVVTGTNVLDVKCSRDVAEGVPRYLAIQRNDTVVVVVNLETGAEWPIACRSKGGGRNSNSVLRSGLAWISSRILMLVTKQSLEFHRVFPTYKLLNTIKHTIDFFWHLPERRVLLVGTGRTRDHDTGRMGLVVIPYALSSHSPTRLASFVLPGDPSQRDVILISLYGSTYCVHNDQVERRLRLYLINRDTSICTREIKLYGTPFCGVSVIDNLLCVHNMESKISLVYDLKMDTGYSGTADDHPTLNPLPIRVVQDETASADRRRSRGASSSASLSASSAAAQGLSGGALVEVHGTDIGIELEPLEGEGGAPGAQITAIRWGDAEPNPLVSPGCRVLCINERTVEGLSFEKIMVLLRKASPLESFRVAPVGASGSSPATAASMDAMCTNATEPYSQSWVFLPPHWVLDSRAGTVWRLELDLSVAAKCATTREFRETAGFLLRRSCAPPSSFQRLAESMPGSGFILPEQIIANGCSAYPSAYSKMVLLRLMREHVLETRSLEEMSMIFASLNKVYVLALRERSEKKKADHSKVPAFNPLTPEHKTRSRRVSLRMSMKKNDNSGSAASSNARSSVSLSQKIKSLSFIPNRMLAAADDSSNEKKHFSVERFGGLKITQFLANLGPQSEHFGFEVYSVSDAAKLAQGAASGIPCSLLPLRDLRTVREHIGVVLQRDLYEHVFVPLAFVFDSQASAFEKASGAASDPRAHFQRTVVHKENDGRVWLANVIVEYVRSLLVRFIRIEPFIYELLAWILVSAGKQGALHQLLQYHILQDSRDFAQLLVSAGAEYSPLWQSGIDMLYRINLVCKARPPIEDITIVVRSLLSKRKLYAALRLMQKYIYAMTRCSDDGATGPRVRPEEFFNAAVASLSDTSDDTVRKGRQYSATSVFASLHHFFLTIDPAIITPPTAASFGVSETRKSPLALAVGRFPSHLCEDAESASMLTKLFGFE